MSDVSPIISGKGLYKSYKPGLFSGLLIHAVRGVDIEIRAGETYALVGASGSGKTTLGKVLLMLIPPSRGEIWFKGEMISGRKGSGLALLRRRMQIIPQHPEDALNPRWKIGRSVLEPYQIHPDLSPDRKIREQMPVLLLKTGLHPGYADRYPHQLSGGELQRVVIARALALQPDFLVCDEPTSMLDVSVQASIIRLLQDIQEKSSITLLFITHDITLARIIADRTGVMYGGVIVEEGTDILDSPLHPYTRSLVERRPFIPREEEVIAYGDGCPWQSACPAANEACHKLPPLVVSGDRKIRCFHAGLLRELGYDLYRTPAGKTRHPGSGFSMQHLPGT